PPEYYVKGVRAVITSARRNETSPLSRIKSLNFLDKLLARRGARSAGAEEALFLNVEGNVAEAAASNVFLVLGGQLVTPDLSSGLLPGITRAAVIEVGGRLGLQVEERAVSLAELRDADEAFLTNSVVELLPLVSVEGGPIGKGKPGPVTLQLHAAYSSLVEEETSAQYTA
ncbi:MAG: aminotransferase class IV family protein, partial [Armatimonadetes bacterium]|nr:aminotransferase class IV family protein [Armatimonadota bacterium]